MDDAHAALVAVVATVVAAASGAEWRLVGTASSAIRGVDGPVPDVDVLFRERVGVDSTFARLATRADTSTGPDWLADASQYFARLVVAGTPVELSTVEIATDVDTWECIGTGPWVHFDTIELGNAQVPTVSSELRLVTEVTRGRIEHITRLIDHLHRVGCNIALIERALTNADVPRPDRVQIIEALSR